MKNDELELGEEKEKTGKEIVEELEELINRGEFNLSIAIDIYGFLKGKNLLLLANSFNGILTKYGNDEITPEDFLDSKIYSKVKKELLK